MAYRFMPKHRPLWACCFGLMIALFFVFTVAMAQGDPPVHPDGWDLTFGGDGMVETGCGPATIGIWWGALHVQQDDKILVYAHCPNNMNLLRYAPDGTLDTTFGTNGHALVNASVGMWGIVNTQQNGKIIVGNEEAGVITRYEADGTLDPSFGTNGSTDHPPALDQLGGFRQMIVEPNDQIVIRSEFGLIRFTADGALDPALAGVGYLPIERILPKPNADAIHWLPDAAMQADNKLLVASYTEWQPDPFTAVYRRKVSIVRLRVDGSIDTSFATDGAYTVVDTTNSDVSSEQVSVFVTAAGQILVTDPERHQLIRLTADGEPDPTFQSPMVSFDHLLEDGDGYLILHGGYWLQRLYPHGALDTSWGTNGTISWDGGFAGLGFQADNRLIASNAFLVMRHVNQKSDLPPPTPLPTATPTPLPTATPLPPAQRALVLIYAVLDNNLGDDWARLVNTIEDGAHPAADVRLLIDGPGTNDAWLYAIEPDSNPFCPTIENPTCNDRYQEGVNYHRFFTEDTARPHALYQFLVDSLYAHPEAPSVVLTIIGHGSGWGANALPAQPSVWRDQNDTLGGMLWDDHPGGQSGSRSLSTLALGQALQWATTETGRQIDLLYLDGCSMGMIEVAYELRKSVKTLLASPNTDWATFSYDTLLPLVNGEIDGITLGTQWLEREAELLRSRVGYPFTLALTDLQQVGTLTTTVSSLAMALQDSLPTSRSAIQQAFTQSDHFDSNYDAKLDENDTYIDLGDFATQLQRVGITNTAVITHAKAVQDLIASSVITVAYQNGAPWIAEDELWQWDNLGGLSLYAPLHEDEARRRIYYNNANLSWTADTDWDEFLTAFWAANSNAAVSQADMPICHATTDGCVGLANPLPVQTPPVKLLYLPLLFR